MHRRAGTARCSSCATSQKSFGAVVRPAVRQLWRSPGSIHALVGENGAGKSTLVKIVAGVHHRDAGVFRLQRRGRRLRLHRRVQGRGHRGDLPGADALPGPLGHREHLHGPPAARPRPPDRPRRDVRRGRRRSSSGSASPSTRAAPRCGLSIADQQIIEIAKAISLDASLLIMDEPTAALSGVEVDRLFAVARSLRDEGRALVFISHRFDEVFALCDTVTVMRDGEYISTDAIAETTVDQIVAKMVGREVGDLFPKTPATIGDVGARGRGPRVRRHLPRRQLHRPGRRDRRPGRARRRRPQRDRPRRLRRRRLRRRLGAPASARPSRRTTRAPRSGPGWPSCPRTAASRAW